MADTVTPNIGLTKPEVGKSDDTWAQKLNTNFDLIDAAIGALEPGGGGGGGGGIPSDTVPNMDSGGGDPGIFVSYSRGDHVHPSDTTKVNLAGDTMSGPLSVVSPPTDPLHAASKDYVDNQIATSGAVPSDAAPLMDNVAAPGVGVHYSREDHVHPKDTDKISRLGDTMTGQLNVPHPPAAITNAVGKQYVDNAITTTIAAVGDVKGPAAAVNLDFVQFDGATGKLIKTNGLQLDIDGTLAANSDSKIPSQKAIKTYIAALPAPPAPPVTQVFGRVGNVNAAAGDYTAGQITFTPVGGLTSVQVQAAIAEVNTNKTDKVNPSSQVRTAVRFANGVGVQQSSDLLIADTTAALTRVGGGGVPLQGTNTNDDAGVGFVGEYKSSNVLQGAALSLTSGNPLNVCFVDLGAGDWDVSGLVGFLPAGTTTWTVCHGGINTTATTLPGFAGEGANRFTATQPSAATGTAAFGYAVPTVRISVNASQRVYLIAQASFAVSTMAAFGIIRARRMR